ncbi:MAG: hypothetical protein WDM84_00415 [Bauldia sp.]
MPRIWLARGDHRDDLAAGLFWTGIGVGVLAKGSWRPPWPSLRW